MQKETFWVISYPKCGRSWLRVMICDAVNYSLPTQKKIDDVSAHLLFRLHPDIPKLRFSHDDSPMLKAPDEICVDKSEYADQNVVFLYRDPRDVLVSWYYQCVARGSLKWLPETTKTDRPGDFIYNETGGLRSIVTFYNIWASHFPQMDSLLLLRYEDLSTDPLACLRQMFDFFSMSSLLKRGAYEYAVYRNEFKRLQLRERANEIEHVESVKPVFGQTTESDDPSAMKVRRGMVGGYVDEFSADEIEAMDTLIEKELHDFYRCYKYRTETV